MERIPRTWFGTGMEAEAAFEEIALGMQEDPRRPFIFFQDEKSITCNWLIWYWERKAGKKSAEIWLVLL